MSRYHTNNKRNLDLHNPQCVATAFRSWREHMHQCAKEQFHNLHEMQIKAKERTMNLLLGSGPKKIMSNVVNGWRMIVASRAEARAEKKAEEQKREEMAAKLNEDLKKDSLKVLQTMFAPPVQKAEKSRIFHMWRASVYEEIIKRLHASLQKYVELNQQRMQSLRNSMGKTAKMLVESGFRAWKELIGATKAQKGADKLKAGVFKVLGLNVRGEGTEHFRKAVGFHFWRHVSVTRRKEVEDLHATLTTQAKEARDKMCLHFCNNLERESVLQVFFLQWSKVVETKKRTKNAEALFAKVGKRLIGSNNDALRVATFSEWKILVQQERQERAAAAIKAEHRKEAEMQRQAEMQKRLEKHASTMRILSAKVVGESAALLRHSFAGWRKVFEAFKREKRARTRMLVMLAGKTKDGLIRPTFAAWAAFSSDRRAHEKRVKLVGVFLGKSAAGGKKEVFRQWSEHSRLAKRISLISKRISGEALQSKEKVLRKMVGAWIKAVQLQKNRQLAMYQERFHALAMKYNSSLRASLSASTNAVLEQCFMAWTAYHKTRKRTRMMDRLLGERGLDGREENLLCSGFRTKFFTSIGRILL